MTERGLLSILPAGVIDGVFKALSKEAHSALPVASKTINALSNDPSYWNQFLKKAHHQKFENTDELNSESKDNGSSLFL